MKALEVLLLNRKKICKTTVNNVGLRNSNMDFEKTKELLKESIDEGANLFEIMEIFTDKVYEQGKQDGKDSE